MEIYQQNQSRQTKHANQFQVQPQLIARRILAATMFIYYLDNFNFLSCPLLTFHPVLIKQTKKKKISSAEGKVIKVEILI